MNFLYYIYYSGKLVNVDYRIIFNNLPILIEATTVEDNCHNRKVFVEDLESENEEQYFKDKRLELNQILRRSYNEQYKIC